MKRLALALIRLYQRTLSRVLPPACRFVPSCSEYGYEAIERYGALRGGVLAIWRVLRCNPWGGHGYDPVPDLHTKDSTHQSMRNAITHDDQQTTALTPNVSGHSLTEG